MPKPSAPNPEYQALKLWLFLLLPFVASCGGMRYVGVEQTGWNGDTIEVRLKPDPNMAAKASTIDVECLTCNYVEPPLEVRVGANTTAEIYYPEAIKRVSIGIHLSAKGVDTTLLIKQRTPKDAEAYFHLTKPLIGRIMASQLAMLYTDADMTDAPYHIERSDELNIYGEAGEFYVVQMPAVKEPLFVLKASAIRLY